VNNSRSGLDVDKLDYFQRDIRHTNVSCRSDDFQRFLHFGRVCPAEPIGDSLASSLEYMVCYPEKMVGEALQLFSLRYTLHQQVYQHKTVKKVEYMLVDALLLADPYIKIPGSINFKHLDGLYHMSECIDDAVALSNLTDHVVYLIETSGMPELRPAQEILRRIQDRKFVSYIRFNAYLIIHLLTIHYALLYIV
jgi:HD superfamily phosphohydrolase